MTLEQKESIKTLIYESSQINDFSGNTRDDERISLLEDAMLKLLEVLETHG